MADLEIRGSGNSFAIVQGGRVVAGPYTNHGNATTALRGVEERLKPVFLVTCLRCRRTFQTKSRGLRLCQCCKRDA